MPEFFYQASGREGQAISGQLSAATVTDAIAQLESRGLDVLSIRLESPDLPSDQSDSWRTTASTPRSSLDRRFEEAIEKREALIPALSALTAEMPSGNDRSEIRRLVRVLRDAETVNDLRRSHLATQWLPLLATGFSEDSHAARLSTLIDRTSRESENRRQWHRAIAYPLVVLVVAMLVFALLCVLVVPTFGATATGMFQEFGLRLPPTTRFVVFISDQLRFHPFRFAAIVGLTALTGYGLIRIWVHYALTTRLLGRFTSGNTINVNAMSSLTSQLAELTDVGVSLPDALWLAGQSCRHPYFRTVAEQLARDAHRDAAPLHDSSVANSVPANVLHALTAGPDGGPSITLLRGLSEMYGERAAGRADWSSGAHAQLAIVIIGVLVGFVVIALFAPMTSLITGLS